ncbi:MAG: serine/threonine-protein phosphatase [Clostridia bacterium]|nr:serine/threonine-protein phosphatase [Clostridia bacterium]
MNVGGREHQEDAIKVSSLKGSTGKGMLTILSDGMGGLAEGERFSAIATEKMIQIFEQSPPLENPAEELQYCYSETQKIAIMSQPAEEAMMGGATVTAALFREGKCTCLSVGDSRIYLKRGDGLITINREQTLGVRLDERAAMGILTWDQAKNNMNRGSLIAHLGRESGIEPDITSHPFSLKPGDIVLQMSDGVFGTLTDDEILQCLGTESLQEAANKIIDATIEKHKRHQDNCSVLMTKVMLNTAE